MYNYSIMKLDANHVEEICMDIKRQYEQGIADCALFMMTLVPEGNPPIKKAEQLCAVYDRFRDRLAQMGLECGVLVQASIGHGYPLSHMFPFTQYEGIANGTKESICCPYDEDFRDHFRHVMAVIASHKPKLIMVDDDFRLMGARAGRGCACPLHMRAFNRLTGTDMTREALHAHIASHDRSDTYTRMFIETQRESLLGAAKAMREGIDSVDKTIPGMFCGVGNACEFADEIAQVLAGEGNPVIVRINNGNYTPAGPRNYIRAMYRMARQTALLKGNVDAILAETDTCPQNRYSTGAQALHAHFVGSILEGASGAKHWLTRTAYEPGSGEAYRRILAKNRGLYHVLSDLVPQLKPFGCCVPVTDKPYYDIYAETASGQLERSGWTECVLDRLGLPLYFSANPGGAVFLNGNGADAFSDKQILEMLKGTLVLASDTAADLIRRGFGRYLGIDVCDVGEKSLAGEILYVNGNNSGVQKNPRRLVLQAPGARADSDVYHITNEGEQEILFPGSTVFTNELGGTVVVFCGTPEAALHYTEGFSFLNESRKLQLIRLLERTGNLPIYYPGDAEVYLRAGYMPDNRMLAAVTNLGCDILEQIPLVTEKKVTAIEYIREDGAVCPCEFTVKGNLLTVSLYAFTLNPVILLIKTE